MTTQDILAVNRAEELGYDVWREFVVPPYFEKLSIGSSKKPTVMIGGRGCGKTMLLRYLSHESTFSKNRDNILDNDAEHIGLYWRADTQFASLMQRREIDDDIWQGAFRHLAAIVLSAELLRSMDSLASSKSNLVDRIKLRSLDFSRLGSFDRTIPVEYEPLRDFLEDRVSEFETWVNDVQAVPKPQFLPGDKFVQRLIGLLISQLEPLQDATFFVYIDEYENLAEYQQRIINTWLKHSEPPLIFNLAMKRNGFKTRNTDGEEYLSNIHDYRIVDLEDFDLKSIYPTFAAEILLLRLANSRPTWKTGELNTVFLRNPIYLKERNQPAYRENVQTQVKEIFPTDSHSDLAKSVFSDEVLLKRLTTRIGRALQRHGNLQFKASEFCLEEYPEASIVCPALLSREKLTPKSVKKELGALSSGSVNRFSGSADWINNNFVACYIQLFEGLPRACPIYSGFNAYCYLSKGNLRHFLELSHQAIGLISNQSTIPVTKQAEAAEHASKSLLSEVRSFGAMGTRLYSFVLRLGSLFALAQQRPSQSEPEINHFSIVGDLITPQQEFLSEAVKWSVLFEEPITKKKNPETDQEGNQYFLNPIYAPYFQISYRRKRRLEFTSVDFSTLAEGSYSDVRDLLKRYQSKWSISSIEGNLPLFSHLLDDEFR